MAFDLLQLALGLGLGGVLGALAAVIVAGKKTLSATTIFRDKLFGFLKENSSPEATSLRASYQDLENEVRGLTDSFNRLKGALRWK
ncbi:MAG: hypothetical protein K8R88_07470 [Armatimonadetes bacterium]|nr:hypothetical protein [Armatimonadota bacterium]